MIIRAPRPASGFTILDNATLRRTDMSRRAKGLLAELLSHTDGWATDSASLADAGPEGRDAIRTTLRELEELGYVRRFRRQFPAGAVDEKGNAIGGRWRTDSYVFDSPVPPDYDPARLLEPAPRDPDRFSTGEQPRDVLDGDAPEPLFDASVFSQVAPTTENPASVQPTPEKPTPGKPTVGSPGAKKKTTEKTNHGVQVVPHVQTARADVGDAPQSGSPASAPATPGRPAGWDEFGPLEPRCRDHLNSYAAGPCSACQIARERFEEAQPKRTAAHRRDLAAAEAEASRRDAAQRLSDEQQVARAQEARDALRRAADERLAARTAESPGGDA